MIRDSLRLRLLAAAAVAILIALVLAGAGMSWFFERHIEQREVEALVRDGKLIAGSLRIDAAGRPVADSQPGDDRYDEAGSGLYWQLTTQAGSVHSESLWDQSLPLELGAEGKEWRVRHAPGTVWKIPADRRTAHPARACRATGAGPDGDRRCAPACRAPRVQPRDGPVARPAVCCFC